MSTPNPAASTKPVSGVIRHLDLKRQLESIRPEINNAIRDILESTAFVGGEPLKNFEAAYARYCGTNSAIGVGNGTDALLLIFWALGLSPGDEVITTSMSFIATVEPLIALGLKPVLVDIEPDTYNLDPDKVKAAITENTKAILAVHLYGQPADMDRLDALAKAHDLYLIEDSAQAHGATFGGKRTGSLGHASAFSFYPGKNLGAYGDGGAVTTNDDQLAQKVRMLGDHGRLSKYEHLVIGMNSRLDSMQAAVLSVKLDYLDQWNAGRERIAERYNRELAGIDDLTLPKTGANRTHVYHQYIVQVPDREALQQFLKDKGVQTGIHYPIPIHRQPAMAEDGYQPGDFPVAEHLADHCLSLPIYAELAEAEVDTVIAAVREYFGA